MKTIILAICILIGIATASQAQIEKGTIIGGVNGNAGLMRIHADVLTNFGINVYSLYAIGRNLAAGLSIDNSFAIMRMKGEGVFYSSYDLLVAPEIRKYYGSGRFMPYIGLATGLKYNYTNAEYISHRRNDLDFYFAPMAGLSYWLNDKVFFDFQMKYELVRPLQSNNLLKTKFGIGTKLGK